MFLESRRGRRVTLSVPQRGEGRALMSLAARNAAETLAREQARWLADEGKTLAALEELAGALGLTALPMRIECYDISTIQGTNTVGSMVVFEEGRPRSGEYRRFRIKTVQGTDDYASHREVLRRRFHRALEAEEGVAEELRWRLPDLVVIDGGLGQVNAARGVLDSLGLADMPAIGLAKEREEVFAAGLATATRAAGDEPGALPAAATARRGPPVRDHVSPQAARQERRAIGARRGRRGRPDTQARAAARVRIDAPDERRDGRSDRRGARHQPIAGREDPRRPERLAQSTAPLRELTTDRFRVRLL